MKLNGEQIIKALECCANEGFQDCENCPLNIPHQPCSKVKLPRISLTLIKELTEENETYEANELNYIRQISRLQAKVEGIKAKTANVILEQAKKYAHAFSDGTNIEEYVHIEDIEQVVREMLEENI